MKNTPKQVEPQTESDNFSQKLFNFITLCFYSLFWFDTRIVLSFFSCLLMFVFRGAVWYLFYLYHNTVFNFFVPQEEWFKTLNFLSLLYALFLTIPFFVFFFWYLATTFFLFYGGFRSCCGLFSSFGEDVYGENESYSEIIRFKNFRDNRLKFMSYEDGVKLLADTSIINNLDVKDPAARKTLDYVNNKLRFRSYQSGLDFLRGNKK